MLVKIYQGFVYNAGLAEMDADKRLSDKLAATCGDPNISMAGHCADHTELSL